MFHFILDIWTFVFWAQDDVPSLFNFISIYGFHPTLKFLLALREEKLSGDKSWVGYILQFLERLDYFMRVAKCTNGLK